MIIHNPEITGSLIFPRTDGTRVVMQLDSSGNLVTDDQNSSGVSTGNKPAADFSGSFTGSFTGDGSSLTGIAATSFNIDALDALGGASVAQGDNFLLSDAGTEKKVTFSNLEDSVFGNVSGDIAIAAGGAASISSGVIVNDDVNASAAIAYSKINFDGSGIKSGSIEGDITGVTAGNGLTGGGTSGALTVNVGAGDGISVAADAVAVDATVLRTTGDGVLSGSAQIAADISGSFVSASDALGTRIDNITSTFDIAGDAGSNDTVTTGETLTFTGDNSITTTISNNTVTFSIGDGIVSSSAGIANLGAGIVSASAGVANLGAGIVSGSSIASAAQGEVALTTNGVAAGAVDLGLQTSDSPQFAGVNVGHASDTTITRTSAGVIAVEGNKVLLNNEGVVSASAGIANLGAGIVSASGNVAALGANIVSSSAQTILNVAAGGAGIVSASVLSSPSQGTARLAINGVNTDADLGLQAGDSPTFANLTLTGNLTVTGDRVEQQVTNLAVEDQFILLNSGASAQDAGLVFDGTGASFGWDQSEGRFAFDRAGSTANQTSMTTDAYVAAVAVSESDTNYQKDGNIFVSSSGDAFIYVS